MLARSITAARVNDRIFGLRTLGCVHSDHTENVENANEFTRLLNQSVGRDV